MKVPEPVHLSSGSWRIQLRLGGRSVSITDPNKKECIRRAEMAKAEHRNGRSAVPAGSSATLEQAIARYIDDKAAVLSPSTLRGYKTIQSNRFASIRNKPLRDIKNWQRIVNDEAKLCSAKTLKNSWGLVASVLKANEMPVPQVTLPQVVRHEAGWLDPDEIRQFVAEAKDDPYCIPLLLALHSLRRSEICALTWDQIDFKNNLIRVSGAVVPDQDNHYIRKETNKNLSSARSVPIMIPELREALIAARSTGPVFAGHPSTITPAVRRVCKRAGLPEITCHGLRHSFASLAYHLGLNEKECMKLGGWSDSTTMHNIYTHISDKDLSNSAAKLAAFFSGGVS